MALTDLKNILGKQGIQFSVIVLPVFWNRIKEKHESQKIIIPSLNLLEIKYLDLHNVLGEALNEGMPVHQVEGDPWHPNQLISNRFSEYLHAQGIF